ncbi:MAG: hypothetical protein ACK4NN_15970 [Rheinheimera sp.]
MAKEFPIEKTDSSHKVALHAVMYNRSFLHNDFYTVSFYSGKDGALPPYQGQESQLLWHSQLQQFDVTIQYDETLQHCAKQLHQVPLAQYFPVEYLMSGSKHLPLSIVLTGQSSFATLNFIDPKNPELRFVFRYSCENSDPREFFLGMTGTVYHETVHYFQQQDSGHYDRYYPAHKETARQRAILRETVATIQGSCAQLLAPIFTSILITKPTDHSRLVLADTPDNAAQHSIAGGLLGIMWLGRFIDNEGFIHKTNTVQYEQVRAACSAQSSELIQQAAAIVAERVIATAPAD